MGMTIAEKILARHAGLASVAPGDYIWCKVDATSGHLLGTLEKLGVEAVWDPGPGRIWSTTTWLPHPPWARPTPPRKCAAWPRKYGISHFFEFGRGGILHQLFPEQGMIAPGELIAMGDSHSTSGGVFNACSTNAGIDALYILAFGELWFRVPHTVQVRLNGTLPPWCVGKDVILHIAGTLGTEFGLYRSIEYVGPVASQMTLAQRWTIANMGVEVGAKFAIFEFDDKIASWLEGRVTRDYEPVVGRPGCPLRIGARVRYLDPGAHGGLSA